MWWRSRLRSRSASGSASGWRRSPYGRQESSSLPGRTDVVIFFVAEGKIIWR